MCLFSIDFGWADSMSLAFETDANPITKASSPARANVNHGG